MAESGTGKQDTAPVRLALRVLWLHCPERWPLITFWEASGQDNEIGRAQGTTAAFNAIVRQLRRSGAYSESSSGTSSNAKSARTATQIAADG